MINAIANTIRCFFGFHKFEDQPARGVDYMHRRCCAHCPKTRLVVEHKGRTIVW